MSRSFFTGAPNRWPTAPLKHVTLLNPEALPETTPGDTELSYVDIAALEGGDASTALTPKLLTFETAPSRARRVLRSGDTVLSTVRTYLKAVANFPEAQPGLIASTGFAVLRPNGRLRPRFAYWAALSEPFIENVVAHSEGVSYPAINPSVLGSLHLPVPSLTEQERIANFLDDKTARIDALIAEKERLVERLSELRYSTVSWAVTGGLHSNKGTFKTGHPFVPELPSGWQLGGLTKYIGPVVDYRGKTPEKVEEGVLLVTARNIRDGLLDYSASAEYVKEDAYEEIMRRGRPEVGDVLFTTEAPLGQVANVDRTDIALAQRVVKFRGLMGVLNNYFLKYWLMGDAVQSTLTTLATGSTAEGIKASKLGQIPIAVPSIEEQAEVVAFLDERRKAFDAVSSHAQDHIARLREYRSSLISAAVTGQLDLGSFEAAKV